MAKGLLIIVARRVFWSFASARVIVIVVVFYDYYVLSGFMKSYFFSVYAYKGLLEDQPKRAVLPELLKFFQYFCKKMIIKFVIAF